jgi:LuxR family maltose regulon positive regulatory protein
VLSVGYVGALLSTGEVEGVESRLRDAEQWLDASGERRPGQGYPPTEMVVVDHEQLRLLPGWVAVYRAAQALLLGDTTATTTHARAALDLLQDDLLGHGAAAALTGLASWARGDLEAAHAAYTDCTASMQRAGHISDVLGCSIALADIRIVQGRLREAMRTYEKALAVVPPDGPPLRGTADMYVGMSTLHYESNDLDGAKELLLRSRDLGEHLGLPQNAYRWRVAMARVRQAEGEPLAAVDLLDEADRVYIGDFSPNVRPVAAVRARLWIAHGRIPEALAWAAGEGLSVEDELSYLREFEHVTLARALLAQSQLEPAERTVSEAAGLLDRLLREAEAGHRTGSVIELLVLQSLTHRSRGDLEGGLGPLARALSLAEPEGYVRTFVDEGPAMGSLLRLAARRGVSAAYAGRLLAALGSPRDGAPAGPGLVESLSERELDVLRLLGTDLSGPEIARELVLSVNTVRTHTKNIYAKLGVTNRRAAVRRGGELGLLTRRA